MKEDGGGVGRNSTVDTKDWMEWEGMTEEDGGWGSGGGVGWRVSKDYS